MNVVLLYKTLQPRLKDYRLKWSQL